MENKKKGYIRKWIRFKDEKEMCELISAIEGNEKETVMDLMVKINERGDFCI